MHCVVLSDLSSDSRHPLPLQLRITAQVGFFRQCCLHSNLRASLKYWCIDPGIPRGPAGTGREQEASSGREQALLTGRDLLVSVFSKVRRNGETKLWEKFQLLS